jgi:hypothetical protein
MMLWGRITDALLIVAALVMKPVNAISAQEKNFHFALGLMLPTLPLVTSSAEASSNPVLDILILAIFACVVIGILWLFIRRRSKRVRK